jgi:hypothetical protein
MKHEIEFNNSGRRFKLQLLNSVEIVSSVENLADTASIVLPESVMNTPLNIEDKISRGTAVTIKLGYDDRLETEFVGFVTDIVNKSGTLAIECEDALFIFRKAVPDKLFKPAPVKDILQYLIDNVDGSFSLEVDADYGITYEKFTIYRAEAYDVLKKIQEELKANIYFDTSEKKLHFHAPYLQKRGEVVYDMSKNVESSSLEYKLAKNRKIEVIIQSTGTDGKITEVTAGTTGGEKVEMKVGAMSESDMQKVADTVLSQRNSDRYEGSIDTWLRPVVLPGYSAKFKDPDYPDRDGSYYVTGVTTSFSDGGGKRTVNFGIKLS